MIEDGVATEGPVPGLTISGGDTVRVVISQVNGDWEIGMMDDTTGQSWVGSVGYYGPGSSAEWVVEDPGDTNVVCGSSGTNGMGQCAMGAYSPPVTFTDLRTAPDANDVKTWDECILENASADMAPGPVTQNASGNDIFSVAYAGGY